MTFNLKNKSLLIISLAILGLILGFFLGAFYANYWLVATLERTYGITGYGLPGPSDVPGGGSERLTSTAPEENPPVGPAVMPPVTCNDLESMAANAGIKYPAKNSQALDEMIACIGLKVDISGITQHTFDVTKPSCNYTHGEAKCVRKCSHTLHSCHYGGKAGTNGAEAVDFVARGALGQSIVDAAFECGARPASPGVNPGARCEKKIWDRRTRKFRIIFTTCGRRTHVHVNIPSCNSASTPEEEEIYEEDDYYVPSSDIGSSDIGL